MKINEETHMKNVNVLANAVELSTAVIKRIAGNAVATSVGGENITDENLRNSVATRIQTSLLKKGA